MTRQKPTVWLSMRANGCFCLAQFVDEAAERFDRRLPFRPLAERLAQEQFHLVLAIEEEVLLAREVVEYRHFRDIGGDGDLFDRHRVEAAFVEQPRSDVGDPLFGLALLAFAELAHGHNLKPGQIFY